MDVISKFSVIGLGDHEASLLGELAKIGTNTGLYSYVPHKDIANEADSKIQEFFDEARLEAIQ
jgi:hypothetical protein